MKNMAMWVVFFLFLGFSGAAAAQNAVSNGAISGHVTDQSGGAVVGASVTVTNANTGVTLTTRSNNAGIYNFPSLPVGTYSIAVTQSGFQTAQIQNVVVEIGQTSAEDATLTVGAISDKITVSAETPLLQTTQTSISNVVNQNLIENLPLSGRRYTDFVLLTPNANADGQFGLVSIAGQQGGADSGYANGNGNNSFTVDGANATSNFYGDSRGRTRVPYVFGEQSIQEFQVANSPYSAVYGGAGTGFINTVTKSGTDTWHGDAFYYNRNSGTGANDYIDKQNGLKRPVNVLQQFGADLGAPIVRDKTWFYFDYEQQRQLEPISVVNTTFSSIGSNVGNAFHIPAGTVLPAVDAPYPVAAGFVGVPVPGDPNYPAYLQGISNAIGAISRNLGPRSRRRDDLEFLPKLDWQPTAADHLSFLYNYNRFNSPGGTITFNPSPHDGDEFLPNNYVRDHHATVHWTHTLSSALLNDLHVSYLRDEQIGTPSGLTPANIPGINLNATVNTNSDFFSLGNASFSVADTKEFEWEIGEQVSLTKGRHDLKFGFDYNRTHITDFSAGSFLGSYRFTTLSQFALGAFSTFNQGSGNPVFKFAAPYYGFYLQDTFRVMRKLTLDLGLREDFQVYPQPHGNPAIPLTSQFPNQYKRFAPRLGFAYQPFSKTVVRGGFGMFYDLFNGINYENSTIANGLASQQSSAFVRFQKGIAPDAQAVVFPNPLPSSFSGFGASSNVAIVSPNFKIPYVLESNLEIQREVLKDTTVTIGSLWTHGVHLIGSSAFDLNLIQPTGTTQYFFCPAGVVGSGPANPVSPAACNLGTVTAPNLDAGLLNEGAVNPGLGQINALISPGVNNYNSLYVQIQRRVSNGLSVMTSYTFSKDMQTSMDFNNQFSFADTHSPALLDQRHRLSVAAVYAPDASGISEGWQRTAFSHWTLSTVMQFSSGRPYTGLLNSACSGGTDLTNCPGNNDTINDSAANEGTGNTANGINGSGPTPGIGFNAFYGPWIQEIDLGIRRDFHIGERNVLSFEVQGFNIFNHANFFVSSGSGNNATQYTPVGLKCGDGITANQQCFLVPNTAFGQKQSINQLNGPRVFQFAFRYRF
ncbi:MAG: TonB-dependent receptor domain-containing protein [Candidatus Acidiferrales bacterium]